MRREDLLDVLTDTTPDDTPVATLLGTTTAQNTYHEWPEDYITPPASVTYAAEGAAATYTALTQPGRRGNITAIITETFRVSGTERSTKIAGMSDPLDYQAAKALKTWKMKQEFGLINGAIASGASGTARQMAGLMNVITTIATARNSGTSLSETELNDMVEDSVNQVDVGNTFDLVLVPFGLKRKIDSFTAGGTKYYDQEDQRLVYPVMVLETSGGRHRVMWDRYVMASAGSVHFLGIREDHYKIAYLRKPFREMLAKDGDRENGQIVGEFTLEYRSERASVKRSGYARTG
ncbi:MAG: SU10 major capsid protein [Patescibacteria group bacterium]